MAQRSLLFRGSGLSRSERRFAYLWPGRRDQGAPALATRLYGGAASRIIRFDAQNKTACTWRSRDDGDRASVFGNCLFLRPRLISGAWKMKYTISNAPAGPLWLIVTGRPNRG